MDDQTYLSRTVGQTVKAWRESQGLRLIDLAERSGLSKGYLSLLENDKVRCPHDQQLFKIARALRTYTSNLVGRILPEDIWLDPALDELNAALITLRRSHPEYALLVGIYRATHIKPLAEELERLSREVEKENSDRTPSPDRPHVTTEESQQSETDTDSRVTG